MNVLHVIPAIARRYGGPSTAVIEMCRALNQTGVKTLIACTDADGPEHLDVPLGQRTSYQGVEVIAFHLAWSESFKYSPALSRWLYAHVGDFDLVHIHAVMSHASVAATRACRKAGVPYVIRTLGTLDAWSVAQKAAKKHLFMAGAGRAMLRSAAVVHATSDEERQTLLTSWDATAVAVIPLGVDETLLERDGSPKPMTPPYVLTLARLHPVKGLDLLIEAFARATADAALDSWRLKIAGDGEPADVAAVVRLIDRSPARSRIDRLGWVEGAAKDALLNGAEIFALTSRHENFGVAIVEALARGVAVVTTHAVQVAPALIEAEAGWVTSLDVDEIATALREAITRDQERRRRGGAGAILARRWSWTTIAQQLVDVYQQVRRGRVNASCAVSRA